MLKTFFAPGLPCLLVFFTVMTQGQQSESTVDSTMREFDTLLIKFPKVYWFNSYKFSIGDYATGKSKQSINSTSHSSKRNYEENKTSYKFTITLETKDTESALITGQYAQHERYLVSYGGILETLAGIESESTETIGNSSKKTVTITTSLSQAEPWNLTVIENDSLDNSEALPTLLRNDTRTILVVSSQGNTDYLKLGIPPFEGYSFIENNRIIGCFLRQEGNKILLRKNLDSQTKLVISAAIMALIG